MGRLFRWVLAFHIWIFASGRVQRGAAIPLSRRADFHVSVAFFISSFILLTLIFVHPASCPFVADSFSQHQYSGSFCSGSSGLLQELMTKSTIRSKLSSFNFDIAAVLAKGLTYVLGETNSYSCHVSYSSQSTFLHRSHFFLPGCTWCEQYCWRCTMDVRLPILRVCTLSFVLRTQNLTPGYFRSLIGVSRVFFHQGIGFKYSFVCHFLVIFNASTKF